MVKKEYFFSDFKSSVPFFLDPCKEHVWHIVLPVVYADPNDVILVDVGARLHGIEILK